MRRKQSYVSGAAGRASFIATNSASLASGALLQQVGGSDGLADHEGRDEGEDGRELHFDRGVKSKDCKWI